MFSVFRMAPAGSGRELCEIDSLWSRKSKKNIKKLRSRITAEVTDYKSNGKLRYIGVISPCLVFPIFCILF